MQYIIDGHNLIPRIAGLSLSDPEDENKLIDMLTPFLRAKKSRAMVFFDHASTGQAGQRNFGLVKAFFVPQGQIADNAIADYLHQLGGSARNYTVVSSDRMVQAAVHAHHATSLQSQEFAAQLERFYEEAPPSDASEPTLSALEIAQWEELFNQYGGNPPDGMSP